MTKKKQFLFIGLAVLIFLGIILGIYLVKSNSTDGARFKREYEAYNHKKSSTKEEYQKLKIDKNSKVKYITLEEANRKVDNSTALIYFGYPESPECRAMVNVLLDTVACSCIEEFLYVDMTDEYDEYEIKDEKPVVKKKASNEYYELISKLDKYLDDYIIKDDLGIEYNTNAKRLSSPLVVAIKDGKVVGAYKGIDIGEKQSIHDELTETQKSEVKTVLSNLIDEMNSVSNVCDEHC